MTKIVFLGGTCGNNNWRDGLIARLTARGVSADSLFNPVVPDWNEAAQQREDQAKKDAAFNLFYLGDPGQADNRCSFYSLLEATMGLYDHSERTVVVFDTTGMPKHVEKANIKACKDLKARFPGALIFATLAEAEEWLATNLV
ncbi:MAG: nucleoside 2-deoxyribosyltransferase domain-containing protein [Patescibacteria group bacterium]